MFTGIVEEIGTVDSIQKGARSALIRIQARIVTEGAKVGDSIAVNGICLTVTSLSNVVPGSIYIFNGNVTLSRRMDFLANPIMATSRWQPATDGSAMAKLPSAFDEVNFFILPSVPLTITDAPTIGSSASLSHYSPRHT